jgi:S-adenosylmethionine:tRNA ribosyltransferase-isomerase
MFTPMKLSKFNFSFNEELVAKEPLDFRDESRMMVVHRDTGEIEHKKFSNLVDYFDEGDVVVLNNTKVFPARLFGTKEKTGARIEVFLLRELNKEYRLWDVLVDPARKIRVGNKLFFNGQDDEETLVAEVIDNTTSRGRTLRFVSKLEDKEFYKVLYGIGETPLPRYMQRKPSPGDIDKYQTIFAKEVGAVAAPAAGMHFTESIFKWFEVKGIHQVELTHHISLGSFRKIEVEDLSKHKMDSEKFIIPDETAKVVNTAKKNGKKVCAVGISTLKAMESSVSAANMLKPADSWTEKFIFPPHEFKIPNALLTNFHAPKTHFFISSATFTGTDLIKKAYKEAIKEKYRFMDYGDVMLIL